MLQIPILRWGKPYESLETATLEHFLTGEPIAKIGQANAGLIERDLRKARAAREALRAIQPNEIIARLGQAAELYLNATLPLGDGQQSADEFVRAQSATTGIPEHMCRANMQKNVFVLANMTKILDALTRGLDLSILSAGHGQEGRGVTVSYQAQAPALGLVLPSNSPGVHALWLPAIALAVGLVIKPGSQEPWTPFRMAAAMSAAGIPAEAISIYPGPQEVGGAVLSGSSRSMIFGGAATVDRYKGDPRVQVHGPGFSKILIGDDVVDRWEEFLDLIVTSIFANAGRSCINASGVWASRHTAEIARAIAARIGPTPVLPPNDPQSGLAAFTVPGAAKSIWGQIEAGLRDEGVSHATAEYGPRLEERERVGYLRPTIVHAKSPTAALAKAEYMFPFATVVECPQEKMLDAIGPTLVCTAITENESFIRSLTDATQIDRLNIGAIPTTQIDWLQPHEGNIVEFLFRARAFQQAGKPAR